MSQFSTQPTQNPERRQQPATFLQLGIATVSAVLSPAQYQSSMSGAYAFAVSLLAPYPGYTYSGFPSQVAFAQGSLEPGSTYGANISRSKYVWAVSTATCYFQIWWDEVVAGSNPSTTPKNWLYTPESNSGLCLPDPATWDSNDPTTYSQSPENDVAETQTAAPVSGNPILNNTTTIRNVIYSFLPGYTPPSDGSANGFPA